MKKWIVLAVVSVIVGHVLFSLLPGILRDKDKGHKYYYDTTRQVEWSGDINWFSSNIFYHVYEEDRIELDSQRFGTTLEPQELQPLPREAKSVPYWSRKRGEEVNVVPAGHVLWCTETLTGWPMRSFICYRYFSPVYPNGGRTEWIEGGYLVPQAPNSGMKRILPYKPMVLPLVANSLIYIGIGAFISMMYQRLRVRFGIVAGGCSKCGYPVAGLQRCPECGQEVRV